MSESQFNYLFTLKNAHLSSKSYNFRMQPNIPMKIAGYMAWILLCKHCKFSEKIYYNCRDIKFFLGDYFFGAPCRLAASFCSTIYFCHIFNEYSLLNPNILSFTTGWKEPDNDDERLACSGNIFCVQWNIWYYIIVVVTNILLLVINCIIQNLYS